MTETAPIDVLHADIFAFIATNYVLKEEVNDYVRMRRVCRAWRTLLPDPRHLAFSFLPRNWMMIPRNRSLPKNCFPHIFSFLHIPTNRCVILDLPELLTHSIFYVTEGLIVLVNKKTSALRLFNPLTRHLSDDLPPMSTMYNERRMWDKPKPLVVIAPSASSAEQPLVMISFNLADGAAFAKPGDNSWVSIQFPTPITSALFFGGRFYYTDITGSIWAVEPKRKLVTCVISQRVFTRCWDIVECDLGMLLVESYPMRKMEYAVGLFNAYKVDPDSGTLSRVNDIGNSVIFVGHNRRTLSVSAPHHSVKRNTIYYLSKYSSFIYDLEQRKEEHFPYCFGSIIDCISKYCTQLPRFSSELRCDEKVYHVLFGWEKQGWLQLNF